jgi:cytochrome c biogenesis protein CcmG/thiol:disulfide interchange protein DsbE
MRLFKLIPLVIFCLVILLLWRGLKLHPNEIPSPLINKPAPATQLPTLFDQKKFLTNKDFIGHVTLLNIWATWCEACAEEHDFLLKLSQNKQIIIDSINYKDNPSAAIKWLQQYGNPYRIIGIDSEGSAAIDWGVYGTPETFIIDKKGIIRYKHIGPIDAEIWQNNLLPIVNTLLGESA